ncbi:anti-sigma factor family protein [Amycolatopsis echigonensis]|uniref:Zf-HC2 domain-containing protein n=1 Tax=Amycolatopsis echigonensis TaxID=2576905 RepID=A0A8E1W509_9PSEU|nr:zf-HC2 domain-containing protein [Amycolatopsis echigonensis]MBB2504037.1 zf-HC2 domain-containing protein [Amycolatopsis echigonensis]
MDRHERMLIAFLAGDLDEPARREWDEHLLGCDQCWQAVREDRAGHAIAAGLREAAPAQLADRVRFAVELAARPPSRRRPRRWILAGGAALVAVVITAIALVWLRPPQPADPPVIAAVVQLAQTMPAPTTSGTVSQKPVEVGAPVTLVADGVHLRVRYYQVGGAEAAVITSDRPFPMPAGAHPLTTTSPEDMAWTVTRDGVALYCPTSDVLLAAPVAAGDLPDLAGQLPLH